ncbi:hypothetical protein ACFL2O_09175 [Thermodesulfobacteriota bacterium]
MKTSIKKLSLILILLFYLQVMISGCASVESYRNYNGNLLPINKVAFLTYKDPFFHFTWIESVDGVVVNRFANLFEILPGNHTIGVKWSTSTTSKSYYSEWPQYITFNARPGHTYIVVPNADIRLRTWNPQIMDITYELGTSERSDIAHAINKYKKQREYEQNQIKELSKKIKIVAIKTFEALERPSLSKRFYTDLFKSDASTYIWIELSVKNLAFNKQEQKLKVTWTWLYNDGSEISKMKGDFIIKPEWETAYISRGWGSDKRGSWKPGTYGAAVKVDGIEVGRTTFKVIN